MTYSGTIDEECFALCNAMNLFPGIQTVESCCGHGDKSYKIWFKAMNQAALPRLIYYFHGCHCGFSGWSVTVKTDCGMSPVTYVITGPIGEQAYKEGLYIASLLTGEMS